MNSYALYGLRFKAKCHGSKTIEPVKRKTIYTMVENTWIGEGTLTLWSFEWVVTITPLLFLHGCACVCQPSTYSSIIHSINSIRNRFHINNIKKDIGKVVTFDSVDNYYKLYIFYALPQAVFELYAKQMYRFIFTISYCYKQSLRSFHHVDCKTKQKTELKLWWFSENGLSIFNKNREANYMHSLAKHN